MQLDLPEFEIGIKFMINTGSEINIIKCDSVKTGIKINKEDVIKVSGITSSHIKTTGSLVVNLFGKPIRFYVVETTFPIEQNGILGSEFLKAVGANVSYTQQCVKVEDQEVSFTNRKLVCVPTRTSIVFHYHVRNPEISEGYISRIESLPGV